jgi:1,4-dihydroxy-2-naphthoyl-CoA hydrolase
MNSEVLSTVNAMSANTLVSHLGIIFTKLEDGYAEATMPVDSRTHQPFKILHGGASVALAETLGSVGANFSIDNSQYTTVGVEINCNHLRSKSNGIVTGKATRIHNGRKIQVWSIEIVDELGKLIATSRMSTMVIPKS